MTNQIDDVHEISGGAREIRRGEGVTWSVDVAAWGTTPTVQNISIVREKDNENVTSSFTTTTTPTVNGNNIVLPKVTIPVNAALGYYRLNFPFSAGGYAPGIPFVRFLVKP